MLRCDSVALNGNGAATSDVDRTSPGCGDHSPMIRYAIVGDEALDLIPRHRLREEYPCIVAQPRRPMISTCSAVSTPSTTQSNFRLRHRSIAVLTMLRAFSFAAILRMKLR
jgi:hypothetical protein